MATVKIKSIVFDPALTAKEFAAQHPSWVDEKGAPLPEKDYPTAHALVEIDGVEADLCGLNVTSAETLKASIAAYVEAQAPAKEPAVPEEFASLIDQPIEV